VHYLRPPAEGEVRIETTLEREGRSLSTVTARMLQDGRSQALATAAFSRPRERVSFQHAVMPDAPPPEALEPIPTGLESHVPIRARFEERWAIGDRPWAAGPNALAGGWIRLTEPHVLDAPLLTALADAWPPAIFSYAEVGALVGGVPTVDLTIHFRAPLPPPDAGVHDWVLVVFRSRKACEGFVEEDGELWSRDGELLVQSRQLAVVG
jgi:acyl-CoA thioesterase